MNAKRMVAIILSVILVIGLLSGCDSGAAPASSSPTASSVASAAPESTQSSDTEETSWPSGSIQFLVPSKAGGITDIYTRYVQKSLQTSTSANFATVNYDTEAVGYENLRSAKPDGSTLLFQHSTIICKYLTGAIDYNPATGFKVVGVVANMGSQAIITNPDAPYDTWDEFVAYAKDHPGEVITGVSTNGTTHFIFGQVQKNCGIELNLVECSSEADKLTNVAGGIINLANCSLGNAKEYEDAGKIKVLGVLGSGQPEENYPEWQPITDVTWLSYLYCLAPSDIDEATAQAINKGLKSLVDDPEYVEECKKIGGTAEWLDLESAQKNFSDTIANLSDVATSLGINARG
ncbi:MAG: Bug family tripartite tricarboxylate transporter substrate binding protein [Oscillospiraceae bacterium]